MRTTVTLDPDVRELIERAMRERGWSFKRALNEAVRAGLTEARGSGGPYTKPRPLGPARIDLTKALSAAGALEDEEISRRLAEGR